LILLILLIVTIATVLFGFVGYYEHYCVSTMLVSVVQNVLVHVTVVSFLNTV
jgi:hypothetical protein